MAQHFTQSPKDSLEIVVGKYYDLNLKIFRSNATRRNIDSIFSLFTDDFPHVHPAYGGIYSRENLYNGYVRNQNNRANNGEIMEIKIKNKMVGLNVVVVQRSYLSKKMEQY